MQTKPFKIGTRGGPLALYQAHEVKRLLIDSHGLSDEDFEIVVLSTKADRLTDQSLSEIGGKGLFTLELEEKLLDGSLDFAVHSSKDMSTSLPEGLHISAYLKREDIRDAFIGGSVQRVLDLPENALIGSSSMRRQALIRRIRPDLRVTIFRGLVGTRLQKLKDGKVDGTMLAYAGMKRLDIADQATEILDTETFMPAPGQGAICIESKIGNEQIDALLKPINHKQTEIALTCERSYLRALDGSCRTPIAAHSKIENDKMTLSGLILSDDGSETYQAELSGDNDAAEQIGWDLGKNLKQQAGDDFFTDWN